MKTFSSYQAIHCLLVSFENHTYTFVQSTTIRTCSNWWQLWLVPWSNPTTCTLSSVVAFVMVAIYLRLFEVSIWCRIVLSPESRHDPDSFIFLIVVKLFSLSDKSAQTLISFISCIYPTAPDMLVYLISCFLSVSEVHFWGVLFVR